MRQRNRILIVIVLFLFIFAICIVLLSTWSLKRIYYASVENTFYLLSFIVENHLASEKVQEQQLVSELGNLSHDISSKRLKLDSSLLSNTLSGIWRFSKADTLSITVKKEEEDDIIMYYKNNLKGSDSHARIVLNGESYLLINFEHTGAPLLMLARLHDDSGIRIQAILDSLVSSSSLVYFAILDSADAPTLYSSFYDNFLPLVGEEGSAAIKTPVGSIYHIEDRDGEMTIVAGFTMKTLTRITAMSLLFFVVMTAAFIASEWVLLHNMSRFERFRLRKEQEVKHFKEVGALSTGFTHEFRNSLNALSLLAKDIPEQEHKHILTQEIDRMRTIMDSLKLTAHLSPGKEPLVLEDILNESVSLLQDDLHAHGVSVHKELAPGLECHGNREMLMVLFSNLLKNSIEAGATLIDIASTGKELLCEIVIQDNGTGIDTSICDRIFEPFFSGKQQTGLGLYLVKKIVELHDGSIAVHKENGTTFTITLRKSPV